MHTGQITEHFDVAFMTLQVFFLFFAGLIVYLRREDKREGYPLVGERPGETAHGIFPATPAKKTFLLHDGSTVTVPRDIPERTLALKQAPGQLGGTPNVPTGNPLRDAVGPAAYALRQDHPDESWEGEARIVPLRVAKDFWIDPRDPDARGWEVVAADGKVAGTVKVQLQGMGIQDLDEAPAPLAQGAPAPSSSGMFEAAEPVAGHRTVQLNRFARVHVHIRTRAGVQSIALAINGHAIAGVAAGIAAS